MDGMEVKRQSGGMRPGAKFGIVAALIVAVMAAIYAKNNRPAIEAQAEQVAPAAPQAPAPELPRFLELGSTKCVPCQMMAPILDQLRIEYAGVFRTEFIDVFENPDVFEAHNVLIIPTQILFDASGKELFRHEGFFAKEDILKKWTELGVPIGPTSTPEPKTGE